MKNLKINFFWVNFYGLLCLNFSFATTLLLAAEAGGTVGVVATNPKLERANFALFDAITNNNLDGVKKALKSKANVNANYIDPEHTLRAFYGKTPLIAALRQATLAGTDTAKIIKIIEFLINQHADVNGSDINGKSVLTWIKSSSMPGAVRSTIEPILLAHGAKFTSAELAAKAAETAAVHERERAVRERERAAEIARERELEAERVAEDAKEALLPTYQDDNLFAAIRSGDLIRVQKALEAGANINAQEGSDSRASRKGVLIELHGRTPLMEALARASDLSEAKVLPIIEYLINYEAVNLQALDKKGNTALRWAQRAPGRVRAKIEQSLKAKGAELTSAEVVSLAAQERALIEQRAAAAAEKEHLAIEQEQARLEFEAENAVKLFESWVKDVGSAEGLFLDPTYRSFPETYENLVKRVNKAFSVSGSIRDLAKIKHDFFVDQKELNRRNNPRASDGFMAGFVGDEYD